MLTFDRNRLAKIIFAFSVMIIFTLLPAPAPITEMGMSVIGVFIGTVLLISTVDTVWPSLLIMPLFALTGVMTMNEAIIGSLGSWVTGFVLMSFILTYALNETGFTQRLTAWFMTRDFASKSPWHFTVSLISLGLIVGLFLDPVPVTAFFMDFSNRIHKELGYTKEDRYPHMVTMALAFSINIAGGMTPISHPLAILGLGIYENATGISVSLLKYMMYGIPIGLLVFAGLLIILRVFFKPDMSKFEDFDVKKVLDNVEPMGLREKITVITFFTVVFFWILPGLLVMVAPDNPVGAFLNKLGPAFPAFIGVVILAVLRVDKKPVLDLPKAFSGGISWGVIFLVGAAVLLGEGITNEGVGLTEFIVEKIVPIAESLPTTLVVLLIVAMTSLLTNFTSNVTTIVLMTGVATSIAVGSSGLDALSISLATTFTGALAYMIPASFASIAVLYGEEYSHGPTIFKYGFIMVIVTVLVVSFVGYPLGILLG